MQSITKAIETLQQNRPIILVDDESRENEGDLIFPAEHISADMVNFFIQHGSGIVCLSLPEKHLHQIDVPLMIPEDSNHSARKTAFTISIEAREGITTGVSAHDRAQTLRAAANPNAKPEDIVSPGHVFPLRAREGGVLTRPGHTEGSIDIVTLAGFSPAAVLCELINKDGTMARMPEIQAFSDKHNLAVLTIADLIEYRLRLI